MNFCDAFHQLRADPLQRHGEQRLVLLLPLGIFLPYCFLFRCKRRPIGVQQAVERPEVAHQDLRHLLADAGDAEREDEAGQRPPFSISRCCRADSAPTSPPMRSRSDERRRRRAGRDPPDSSPARARPAGRRSSRPAPRCPWRGGRRSAAASACAAPCNTGRRCSASRPRPARRTTGESQTGQRLGISKRSGASARRPSRARRRPPG